MSKIEVYEFNLALTDLHGSGSSQLDYQKFLQATTALLHDAQALDLGPVFASQAHQLVSALQQAVSGEARALKAKTQTAYYHGRSEAQRGIAAVEVLEPLLGNAGQLCASPNPVPTSTLTGTPTLAEAATCLKNRDDLAAILDAYTAANKKERAAPNDRSAQQAYAEALSPLAARAKAVKVESLFSPLKRKLAQGLADAANGWSQMLTTSSQTIYATARQQADRGYAEINAPGTELSDVSASCGG